MASCSDGDATKPAEQPDEIKEDELLLPEFITKTDDSALFVVAIQRQAEVIDGTRTQHLQIDAQVPITSFSTKDDTFSGKGYGMLVDTGSAGPTTVEGVREMQYEIKGSFSNCDIFFDEIIETWGEGEYCATAPIAGTECYPIPEGETDYLLLETDVAKFDPSYEDGAYWWVIHEWDFGEYHWVDSISIEDWGTAVEMKIFEFMECKVKKPE